MAHKSNETKIGPGEGKEPVPVPDWLKDVLECPGCQHVMTDGPIRVCGNDHSLCLQCCESNEKCPVCQAEMTERRNLMVESIVDKMPKVSCKFDGCRFKMSCGELVRRHEAESCSKRRVTCGICEQGVEVTDLVDHMVKSHAVKQLRFPDFSAVEEHSLSFAYLRVNKKSQKVCEVQDHFFLVNWMELDDGCVIFWMAWVGAGPEAETFRYTLQVLSSKDKKNGKVVDLFEGSRRCVPCDLTHNEMKVKKCGLVLDRDLIVRAADGNSDKLQFNLCIKKA